MIFAGYIAVSGPNMCIYKATRVYQIANNFEFAVVEH